MVANPTPRRIQGVQDGMNNSTERDHAATDHCMREDRHEQIDMGDQVSKTINLVGDILCPMLGLVRSKRQHEEGTNKQMA
jgi:hypothetical protein